MSVSRVMVSGAATVGILVAGFAGATTANQTTDVASELPGRAATTVAHAKSGNPRITVAPKRKKSRTVATKVTVLAPVNVTVVATLMNGKVRTVRLKRGTRTFTPAARTITLKAKGHKTVTRTLAGKKRTYALKKASAGNGSGSTSFKFNYVNGAGLPSRWDACVYETAYSNEAYTNVVTKSSRRNTLTWSYGNDGTWADAYLRKALANTTAATGWNFKKVASDGDLSFFVDRKTSAGSVKGLATWSTSQDAIYSATINVSIGSKTTIGQNVGIFGHEIGHSLGLDHVNDSTQLMYPHLTSGDGSFRAGDRAGLAQLGVNTPCVLSVGDEVYGRG